MKRSGVAMLLTVALSWAAPSAAIAQEGVELEASVGLQGYVAPLQPTTATVRVTAQVLFVGDLQLSVGSMNLFTTVEVPAGSSKEYTFSIPSVGNDTRALVQLVPDDGSDAIARETLGLRFARNEVLVGTLGTPGIEAILTEIESVPFGTALTVLSLEPADLQADLTPLSYLVVGPEVLAGVSPEILGNLNNWVAKGGRIVGMVSDLNRLEIAAGEAAPLTSDAVVASAGSGELILVDNIMNVDDWGPLIRDVPPAQISTNVFVEDFGFQMIEAASAGGESTTPGLPWLLGALAIYVLLIGPVNFLVLRRFGRPELAWVTIPGVSVVMVAGLWLVGRSQLDDRIVTHASIMVQQGSTSRARSTLIVVAGAEGNHTLDVPAGWSLAPLDTSMMFGQQTRLDARVEAGPDGGTRLGFELPNLGAATATAMWNPPPVNLAFDVQQDGNALVATAHNDSALSFWAWGIGGASSAIAARGPLEAGQSGDVRLVDNQQSFGGSMIADAVFSSGRINWDVSGRDPGIKVWPLAEAMSRSEPGILNAPYFFGYTDDLVTEVLVDGLNEQARGPSLVVIPLDVPATTASAGVAQVIEVVGADFVDGGAGWMYAHGAESLHLRFLLGPDMTGDLELVNRAGHLPGVEGMEVYNWASESFDEYEWPSDFPATSHISPTGEVMIRILLTGGDFSDIELPAGGIVLQEST